MPGRIQALSTASQALRLPPALPRQSTFALPLPAGRSLATSSCTQSRPSSSMTCRRDGSRFDRASGSQKQKPIYPRRSQSTSTSTSASTRPCPSCSTPLSPAVSPCPECSTLIPLPSGLSLHSLLAVSDPIPSSSTSAPYDIPSELSTLPARGFDLAPRDLRNRMLARQRDLHPDKFGSSGERVVSLAKELSGRVNMAYETLADPLKRAEYILSVHDFPVQETDSLTDPMLLGEIMEAREELEEAQTEAEVDALRAANHEKVTATIAALQSAFSADPPALSEAKSLAVQLKYWMSLEAAAKEWTPGKGAGLSAGSSFSHS